MGLIILPIAFLPTVFVAVLLGLRAGRADPQSIGEFVTGGLWAFAWAVAFIFTWHALWVTSVFPAQWQDTVRSAAHWTLITGTVWVPVLGIVYVLRALKARRDG